RVLHRGAGRADARRARRRRWRRARDGRAHHRERPPTRDGAARPPARAPVNDGIVVRPLTSRAELEACAALQQQVWGADFSERVPPTTLWLARRLGGVVSGAFDPDGRLVGFVFGMTGVEHGRPVHWSDMLAVLPEHWNRGVGQRLKQHQREEALRLGVETIYWTFDPLESKNAYLNLSRLGGVASEYWRDAYGQTDSPLHRGIGTDRLVIEWRIASPRVVQRLAGDRPAPTFADIEPLPAVNDVRPAAHGLESTEPDLGLAAERVRLVIPAEIQELKTASPALADRKSVA